MLLVMRNYWVEATLLSNTCLLLTRIDRQSGSRDYQYDFKKKSRIESYS